MDTRPEVSRVMQTVVSCISCHFLQNALLKNPHCEGDPCSAMNRAMVEGSVVGVRGTESRG